MKKQQNKIDEYFREALQDHTVVPSEAAKEAFLKEAAMLEGSRKSYRYLYFYLAAFLLLLSAGAGLLLVHQDVVKTSSSFTRSTSSSSSSNSLNEKKRNSIIHTNQSESRSIVKNEMATTQNSGKKTNTPSQKKNQNTIRSNNLTATKTIKRNEFARSVASPMNVDISNTAKTLIETQTIPTVAEQKSPVSTQAEEKASVKNEVLYSPPVRTVDTLTSDKNTNNAHITGSAPTPANWNVTLGSYYAPEWLFNTLEGEKYVNNFGIEGTFHFGRYSIRTGAGLSITKGTNELSVNYNDYLGNYNKLDSIQFFWNATHSNLVPTYYFSNENVWDSLLKIADAKVVKRYTYLQIPLILGYDFWQNENFSIGLRGGPILSVLLKTEVLSDNYDPGMNKIILINRIAPERIQTNWQVMGGINATFRISRRLGIELEPEIRYYFNSVYEKSANYKKPWSTGIHAAFIMIL
jgi:hypothetical protein